MFFEFLDNIFFGGDVAKIYCHKAYILPKKPEITIPPTRRIGRAEGGIVILTKKPCPKLVKTV